jgi:hypothetical protein
MTSDQFLVPWDITQSATEGFQDVPVSAGTAARLIFQVGSPTAPGGIATLSGSQTATLTLRKNGADTLLTCTIPNNGSSCTNSVNNVTFVDGDSLTLRYTEAGNPNVRVKYSFQFATQ